MTRHFTSIYLELVGSASLSAEVLREKTQSGALHWGKWIIGMDGKWPCSFYKFCLATSRVFSRFHNCNNVSCTRFEVCALPHTHDKNSAITENKNKGKKKETQGERTLSRPYRKDLLMMTPESYE